MQERRAKRGVVGWPYFLSGELYGGALRYDRRMDYHFSLFPPPSPTSSLSPSLCTRASSLLRALSSSSLRVSCKKPRLRVLHLLTLSAPTLLLAKTCKAEWAKGGWVGGWPWSRRALEGGNDVTRRRGWVGKGDQGRTFREMFLFPCLFSSFRPLLPTRSSFLARAPREDSWGWLGGYGGGKERKKGKKGRAVEERRKADANPVKRG